MLSAMLSAMLSMRREGLNPPYPPSTSYGGGSKGGHFGMILFPWVGSRELGQGGIPGPGQPLPPIEVFDQGMTQEG